MKYTFKNKARRGLITLYHALGVDKLLMKVGRFDNRIEKAIKELSGNSRLSREELKKDIKACYCKYLTTPEEYFLYDFEGKDHAYRNSFLPDNYRIRKLISVTGEKKFVEELTDKYNFYRLTKKYFGRDAYVIGKGEVCDFESFKKFTESHRRLFVKPLSMSYGMGAHILDITDETDIKALYNKYLSQGVWIIEDRIVQSKEMEVWNDTCINTVRIPCFNTCGKFHVLNPFLRTGRKGAVVDNAGAGGIFACLDETSGKVITDGIDEANTFYEIHPDAGLRYKGWKVPKWDELLALAEKILKEALPGHIYVGFDFALTEKGWVLIEGNWGQFVGQYASRKGVKKEFLEYLRSN